jgi:DNA-binding transcriptional LysR family regulator
MELRHLRYFTAVVRWNGYREASRQMHVAQPALSQAVSDLEEELGLKLFMREKRRVRLTPEGSVFYAEAIQTLEQANRAMEAARRAARGEIGTLRIGFLGSATAVFLPELVRLYRSKYPGVKITLDELTPLQQEEAFAKDQLDVGFTRPLTNERAQRFNSRLLYSDPLLAAVPHSFETKSSTLSLKELENKSFVLFHRVGAPDLFDTITGICNKEGFVPKVEQEPRMMQTVLSLVAAEVGVSLIPACVRILRSDGVKFLRVRPDNIKIDLVVTWPKDGESVVLRSFLDLLSANANNIRRKTKQHLP